MQNCADTNLLITLTVHVINNDYMIKKDFCLLRIICINKGYSIVITKNANNSWQNYDCTLCSATINRISHYEWCAAQGAKVITSLADYWQMKYQQHLAKLSFILHPIVCCVAQGAKASVLLKGYYKLLLT